MVQGFEALVSWRSLVQAVLTISGAHSSLTGAQYDEMYPAWIVLSHRFFGSSLLLTISLFLHLLPLLVPFLEVSFHVLFLFVSRSEPSLSGVTKGGICIVEEREECMCWTLRCVGGRLGLGLGLGIGGGELGWAMKRDSVSMDNMKEGRREDESMEMRGKGTDSMVVVEYGYV